MKTVEAFRTHFEGLPNNILWHACNAAVRGISYSGCTKDMIAEAFVTDKMGIGLIEMTDIDDQIIALYAAGKMGPKQSAVVFNWLSREKLLQKMLKVKRGTKAALAC
jgi:hypothetical protein